jgi:GAF domain-containing protein
MVGETGIVGYVTSVGQPRVALDVGADATYFNNPDLPNTHSEIALPLRVGSDTFGALDVQSTETNAFSAEDISILSVLADQVSIAIQNARSYQQSREALAQAEKVSSQLSGVQWKRFVEQQRVNGYYFDGTNMRPVTPEHQQREHHLTIPLVLRGMQIGAIKVNASNPAHEWTEDELSVMQAAADRASLALENARLLEESQRRATKERTIGDISTRIGSVTDLEGIIQTAMQEIGNTLPGIEIDIQFTDNLNKM